MDLQWLVLFALLLVGAGVALGARVVSRTPESTNVEVSKIRFAAATFTGILLLIVFICILYFVSNPTAAGKEIFDKLVPALTPIAGAIVGYIFGTRGTKRAELAAEKKEAEKKAAAEKAERDKK
jgi:hypothetical protein